MQRITLSIDDALAETLDGLLAERGYASRSEGVRDALRETVERWRGETADAATCVANLSYVYDTRTRSLAARLADHQHAHHDLVVTTSQVRLDHDSCLETVVLRGASTAVKAFADRVRAERGVRFGTLSLIGVEPHDQHAGEGDHVHPGHLHYSPQLR